MRNWSTQTGRALRWLRPWSIVVIIVVVALGAIAWLVAIEAPIIPQFLRLYEDASFLKESVRSWGWLAPLAFIGIQALQVIIAPIPGEITGPVGGALFGTLRGIVYSTIGFSVGTLLCFWIGRRWGEPAVRPWLSEGTWFQMRFIVDTQGATLCFVLYLIPGFPKDIISYLFGLSPIRFWVFAVVSTDREPSPRNVDELVPRRACRGAALRLRDRIHRPGWCGVPAGLFSPARGRQAPPGCRCDSEAVMTAPQARRPRLKVGDRVTRKERPKGPRGRVIGFANTSGTPLVVVEWLDQVVFPNPSLELEVRLERVAERLPPT